MNITEKKKSHDFNIYYLNFSKVYEIAMMINNVTEEELKAEIETQKAMFYLQQKESEEQELE